MHVVNSNKLVYFDVDDTLIIWSSTREMLGISDQEWASNTLEIGVGDFTTTVMPHERHIEFLRDLKCQGCTIMVWSHGGHKWAAEVLKVLDIEMYVDYVMDKPNFYIDDLDASKWMGRRLWHHPTKKITKDPETK
jgi:FMN phosphatase YigB (HAD superfamily)